MKGSVRATQRVSTHFVKGRYRLLWGSFHCCSAHRTGQNTSLLLIQFDPDPIIRQRTRFTRLNRKWHSIEEKTDPDFQYSHAKATPRNHSGTNVAACKCTAANTAPDINAETIGNDCVSVQDFDFSNRQKTNANGHINITENTIAFMILSRNGSGQRY